MATSRHEVRIETDNVTLKGDLTIPDNAFGIVVFAHGSGSSRKSSRNRYVAEVLQQEGLATLLMDLLTADEEQRDMITAHLRFDIELLSERVSGAIDWVQAQGETMALPLGLFGASTGGAAALVAAAAHPEAVRAVVSRGGRPDLAGSALPRTAAPTLLIVGGDDLAVIQLNRQAMGQMHAPVQLEIVPGATHLFEEPGKLEEVARLAADWFKRHLVEPSVIS